MLNTHWYEWMRQDIERHNEQMKKINAPAHWYQDADAIIADCKKKVAERMEIERRCKEYGINFHYHEDYSMKEKFDKFEAELQAERCKLLIEYCKDLRDKYDKLEARVTALEKKFDEVSG